MRPSFVFLDSLLLEYGHLIKSKAKKKQYTKSELILIQIGYAVLKLFTYLF